MAKKQSKHSSNGKDLEKKQENAKKPQLGKGGLNPHSFGEDLEPSEHRDLFGRGSKDNGYHGGFLDTPDS